jgi:hypothetical protein
LLAGSAFVHRQQLEDALTGAREPGCHRRQIADVPDPPAR